MEYVLLHYKVLLLYGDDATVVARRSPWLIVANNIAKDYLLLAHIIMLLLTKCQVQQRL